MKLISSKSFQNFLLMMNIFKLWIKVTAIKVTDIKVTAIKVTAMIGSTRDMFL
jgi:hypothetical protein